MASNARFAEVASLVGDLARAGMLHALMDGRALTVSELAQADGSAGWSIMIGNSTTFLSQFLTRLAVGQFDLGPAAAFSLIYFVFILFFCYVFYTVMNRVGQG